MKGASAGIVLVLLIMVGIAVYFFLQGGFPIFGTSQQYDNTIIHVEDKFVTSSEPFSNTETSIIFYVTNRGDRKVDKVTVDFTNILRFHTPLLSCQLTESIDPIDEFRAVRSCDITNIEPGDSRQVVLKLTADSVESPLTSAQGIVTYSIKYHYTGERFAEIPIINVGGSLPAGVKFLVGSPSVGPIQLNIAPPVGSRREEGGQTIEENFARVGLPFTVKFEFTDVGNPEGTKVPVKFEGTQVKLMFTNGKLQSLECDKYVSGGLKPKVVAEVPFEIECLFQDRLEQTNLPDSGRIESYEIGTFEVLYEYDYEFENTENFVIRALSRS